MQESEKQVAALRRDLEQAVSDNSELLHGLQVGISCIGMLLLEPV